MTNFDRLGQKDTTEKQTKLTGSADLTEQLAIGVKAAGLDKVHDARLIQLKYLSQGGKNFDQQVIGKFDFTKQTNVETNRKGVPKIKTLEDGTNEIERKGKPGVKEFLQPFVDIKNVFGQGFLDHALYDYNIPYGQLEQFSKELKSIYEALRQGLIRLTAEEEMSLLSELQVGDVDKNKFLETQKAQTLDVSDILTVKESGPVLEQQKTYINALMNKNMLFLANEFRGDLRMDADAAHNIVMGLTGYTGELITVEMNKLSTGRKDGSLTTLDLHTAMDTVSKNLPLSPFIQGLKAATICKDVENKDCTFEKFGDLEEFRTPDLTLQFLKATSLDPQKIVLHEKSNGTKQEQTGTQVIASFTKLGEKLKGLKNPTQAEVMAVQGEIFLNKGLSFIEKGADFFTTQVDKLKESGMWDKVEKIRNLLFGDGDFLDRLSKFNEMKESGLSQEKTLALNQGFGLIKDVLPIHTGTNNLPDFGGVKKTMNDKLFVESAFDNNEVDSEWATVVKNAANQISSDTYTKLLAGTPLATDVMDVTMRAMCGTDTASYTSFTTARKGDQPSIAKSLFDAKFDVVAGTMKIQAKSEKRDFGTKPNETFARGLLATILDSTEAGKGMVNAATNETQKGVDSARVELNTLTKDMNMRVDGDKLYLDGIPTADKVGIKTDGSNPTLYNHTNGFTLSSLGNPPKFTLVKQQADGKWSDMVRLDNISVVPSTNVEMAVDNKTATVKGLEAGDYLLSTEYTNDQAKQPAVETGVNVAVKDAPLTHMFDAGQGIPTTLRVKPKTGGLWQTIWKST